LKPRVVKMLLDEGADPLAKDEDGWTPLHHTAAIYWGIKCAELVLNKATINARTGKDETPLHLAAKTNDYDVINYLIDNGADKEVVDFTTQCN
jgi:ankyrin repeat protein